MNTIKALINCNTFKRKEERFSQVSHYRTERVMYEKNCITCSAVNCYEMTIGSEPDALNLLDSAPMGTKALL